MSKTSSTSTRPKGFFDAGDQFEGIGNWVNSTRRGVEGGKVLKVLLRGDESRVAHFRAPASPRGICTGAHRCEVREY